MKLTFKEKKKKKKKRKVHSLLHTWNTKGRIQPSIRAGRSYEAVTLQCAWKTTYTVEFDLISSVFFLNAMRAAPEEEVVHGTAQHVV